MPGSERIPLIKKYNIPVENLDYGYIKKCTDKSELEKILLILISEEEGSFPDLLQYTKERLRIIDQDNFLLREPGIAITNNHPDPAKWNAVVDDLNEWMHKMSACENDLLKEVKPSTDVNLPPIRKRIKKEKKTEAEKNREEHTLRDKYAKWDSYDVDAECLKLDMEPQSTKSSGIEQQLCYDTDTSSSIQLTKTEKNVLWQREKELGDEFYRAGQYNEAIAHYSQSLAIFPSVMVYNNRAAAYKKINDDSMVISDTTLVIEAEPKNVKALYRRATAYENTMEYEKALSDLRTLIDVDPHNTDAQKRLVSIQLKTKRLVETSNSEYTNIEGNFKSKQLVMPLQLTDNRINITNSPEADNSCSVINKTAVSTIDGNIVSQMKSLDMKVNDVSDPDIFPIPGPSWLEPNQIQSLNRNSHKKCCAFPLNV